MAKCGGSQDGVTDHGKKATVEGYVQDGFPHLDGFHSPLPEPFGSSLDCGVHKILGATPCCGVEAAGGGDELVVLLTRVSENQFAWNT